METVEILDRTRDIGWEYDEEADVLYLSIGEPKPSVGVDVGEGVVVRYDEADHAVTGVTLIGFRDRVLRGLADIP